MPAPTQSVAVILSNNTFYQNVRGALAISVSNGLGGGSIRDTNIYKFQQGVYDSKRLTNMVLTLIAGNLSIDIYSDYSAIQQAVDNYWVSIFDVPLT